MEMNEKEYHTSEKTITETHRKSTKDEIIYMKAELNTIVNHRRLLVEDVVDLYGGNQEQIKSLKRLVFYQLPEEEEHKYVFDILKVVEVLRRETPGIRLLNLGQTEFVVTYAPPSHSTKLGMVLKTIAVCLIAFMGAAFAIMTFNTDVSTQNVFERFYRLVMGTTKKGISILEIMYAIGLFVGIMTFYNHFSVKKSQIDPTPIQVEMRKYEQEVNQAVVATAAREGKVIEHN